MTYNVQNISLFLFSILVLMSCDYDDDSGQPIDPTPTTFEIIQQSEDHEILEELLKDTGLDEVLNEGVFTVFAPNDEAFTDVDLSSFSNEEITNLLLHHVVTGNASSTDLSNGYQKTNAVESFSGDKNFIDMVINVDGGITLNGASTVVDEDIFARNGTIHVVNGIIPIPDLNMFIEFNPNFSNLDTALVQENLKSILSTNIGSTPAPLTLFGPNDNAFDTFIAEDNGFDSVQDILDSPLLTDVLSYHLLSDNAVFLTSSTEDLTFTTVQGESILISTELETTLIDQNDRESLISEENIVSSNGILHLVDNVLLPMLP